MLTILPSANTLPISGWEMSRRSLNKFLILFLVFNYYIATPPPIDGLCNARHMLGRAIKHDNVDCLLVTMSLMKFFCHLLPTSEDETYGN